MKDDGYYVTNNAAEQCIRHLASRMLRWTGHVVRIR
jgi:hypothetical protein